jgi:phosphatidylglycerophosphate synthase
MHYSMEELRELCKKEYYTPFQENMHHLMLYVTRPLIKTNITPNQITTFWLLLQLFASGLMLFGEYYLNVLGIILFTVAMLLDYVDGQIARIKKISSAKGIYLEQLGIHFGSPIFFLCFGVGTGIAYNNVIYFGIGASTAILALYTKMIAVNPYDYPLRLREEILNLKKSTTTRTKNKTLAIIGLLFRRSQPINFLFLGILLNIPRITIFTYATLYFLEIIRKLYLQIIKLNALDKETT